MPPLDTASLPPKRKLFIKTWGCQMNVYDSSRMADVLAPLGFETVDTPGEADLAILNTCHIREKATEKVFSDLGRLRPHKAAMESQGKKMIVAVAGCVAQAEGAEIMRRAPLVDLVFGPQSYHRLPEMIAGLSESAGLKRVINTDFPADSKFDSLPAETIGQGVSAYLSVQEGCDKFCSFCVVPYTRGSEYSRDAAGIIAEAKTLLASGAREITLLGQNVNAWHGLGPDGKTWKLGRLIRELAALEKVERIRYTTSHPRDMEDELIEAHRDVPQLMPFLHLPVQSGSDRVLELMNRKHTADDYRRIIDRVRDAKPDIALSSDFIVGAPGESEDDFAATVKLAEEIGFASAYSFKYSPRAGTPAAKQQNQIAEPVKEERLQVLQELLGGQQLSYNQGFIGKTLPVLLDRAGGRPGQMHGRTPYMQAVHLNLPEQFLGHTVDVTITTAQMVSLTGESSHQRQTEMAGA
jgi:tRNA-2-methylthio-N6-dimethylallyladenosine synthase